jgi:PAS domain S-box-containing protein
MAGEKILLVSSQGDKSGALKSMLQNFGYEVSGLISSDKQGMKEAQETSADLAIICSGLDDDTYGRLIASRFQGNHDIPTIMIIDQEDENIFHQAIKVNPYSVLCTPVSDLELRYTIEFALNRHRTEIQNRTSDQWLKAILDNTREAIIIIDENAIIKRWNLVTEVLTGWKESEVLEQPLMDYFRISGVGINNASENSLSKSTYKFIETTLMEQMNRAIQLRNDTFINIVARANPIESRSGEIKGAIITFHYITLQKELDKLVKSILEWASELLGAHASEIFLYDKDLDLLRVTIPTGFMEGFTGVTLKPGEGLAGRVFLSGEPMMVKDYVTWEGKAEVFEKTPLNTTVLHVPLIWQDKCIGTLGIDADNRTRTFTENDVQLASLFANLAAVAIENLRLYEELQIRSEEQKRVLEQKVMQRTVKLAHLINQLNTNAKVSREITSILEIRTLLDRIVELICTSFNYYFVQIFLSDNENNQLTLEAANGKVDPTSQIHKKRLIIESNSLNGLVAQSLQSVMVNDVSRNPSFYFDQALPETKSELVVPLKIGARIFGTLDIQSEYVNTFGEEDRTVFETLGDQIAIAIENARLYEHSRELAVLGERNRMARELHDSVIQSLFSLELHAKAISKILTRDPQGAERQVEQLRQIIHDTLEEMRTLIIELRPSSIEDIGLVALFRQDIQRINSPHSPHIEFCVSGERRLSSGLEEGLYRIGMEALRNALKHSGAKDIKVDLAIKPDIITLSIVDDGRGFDLRAPRDRRSFGLVSMFERAQLLGAQLDLASEPGEGTRIVVSVPIGE